MPNFDKIFFSESNLNSLCFLSFMTPTVDFGQVQYGCTKYKRRMVLYESVTHPGKRFVSVLVGG
jgi:hypothetical protein